MQNGTMTLEGVVLRREWPGSEVAGEASRSGSPLQLHAVVMTPPLFAALVFLGS